MTPEKILENYINDLERELAGLSFRERQEITTEIRTHLVERWQEGGDEGAAGLLNILEQFGDPKDIAQEYIPKPQNTLGSPPVWLVVVLTVFLWPIGIVLAWISSHWQTKNKVIATLIPIVLTVLVIGAMIPVNMSYYSFQTSPIEIGKTRNTITYPDGSTAWDDSGFVETDYYSGPASWVQVLGTILSMAIVILFLSSPLISGIYLAITKRS